MNRIPVIFLLLFFSCARAGAQEHSSKGGSLTLVDSTSENMDPSDSASGDFAKEVLGDTSVTFRQFVINRDSLLAWKNQKDFSWIKNLDSLLHEQQNKSNRSQPMEVRTPSLMERFFSSAALRFVLWIIAACVVGFIIYRLFLSKGIFGRASAKAAKETDEEEAENIADKDFNYFLNKAYGEGDLRTSTRYLFLMTLQKLDQKELIRYGADKTNSVYMYELPPAKRNDFASLSLYYEYIWYGKAPLQKETFDMIRVRFNDFLNKI